MTSWNGLAIAGLADAGLVLGRPDLVARAEECAELVVSRHLVDGRLRRVSRDGVVGTAAAVADDHGNLAEGLLALHQATGDARWLEAAGQVLTLALRHFRAGDGGFHDTARRRGVALLATTQRGRQRRAVRPVRRSPAPCSRMPR